MTKRDRELIMWKRMRNTLCVCIAFTLLLGGCGGKLPSEEPVSEGEVMESVLSEASADTISSESDVSLTASSAEPTESSDTAADELAGSAVYQDFCARKEKENREQMQTMLAMARESVYDVLKAYDSAQMLEYSAPSTVEEIFTDGVIDEICGGNSVAKAAVSEAVECFRSGEGLGSTFGKTMDAAVEAIPAAVKDKFVEMIVPGCITKMFHLYDTLEANSNLQIKYAINKLQGGFQRDVDILTAILLEEDLTGDELKRAAWVFSDVYDTVDELENRFQVSMAIEEWWLLDACMSGIADEYYRCDFLAAEYARAGREGADPKATAFTGTEEDVNAWIEERDFYYQNPDNFVVQYSWLLEMKQNLAALKYFDYMQLQKDSTENFVAGTLSNLFGNFITDMFAVNKTDKDNLAVDVLYEYTDTCKQALDQHIAGFEGLANIKLEIDALYVELVNSKGKGSDEVRCALYFYQNYFGEEPGPTWQFYKDRINSCAGEITAYYLLLKKASSGQKALMSQEYLSNAAYLSELETDLMWIERSLYGENVPGMDYSVDIGRESTAIAKSYADALGYLCIDGMRVNDVYQEEYTVNLEGRGAFVLTCYRKQGLTSPYDSSGIEDAVIAMTLKKEEKTILTCVYDCESEINAAYTPEGAFAYFGIGEQRFGIIDCNLSAEEKELWDFYLGIAGADIYSDVAQAAEGMALCVESTAFSGGV